MADLVIQPETLVVEVGVPGPPGRDGQDGRDGLGAISADPDNRLGVGTDGGLKVPELAADPLAYYILARS